MPEPITTPELQDVALYGSTADAREAARLELIRRARPDAPTLTPAACPTCWSSTPSIRLPIGSIRRIERCEDPWHDETPTPAGDDQREALAAQIVPILRSYGVEEFDGAGDIAGDVAATVLAARPSAPTVTTEQRHSMHADAVNLAAKVSPYGHPLPVAEIRAAWAGVDATLAALGIEVTP